MSSRTLYCIRQLRVVAMLCLLTGCWQEIEYHEPEPVAAADEPESAVPAAEQPAVESPPAAEIPAPVDIPAAEAPAAVEVAGGEGVGDRYASSDEPINGSPSEEVPTADAPPSEPDFETSPTAESEAATVSATVETDSAPQVVSTRRAAWLLGSRLGLAALANDRNVAPEETVVWLDEARSMAGLLGTSIVELPERPANAADGLASREVLSYLLSEGRRIGGELATNQGADHASMFEVALKSNLLLVLNKPGSSAIGHISTAIERAAPQAGLPEESWRPLLDTLANGSPPVEVRAAVRKMHAHIDRHLATGAEQ